MAFYRVRKVARSVRRFASRRTARAGVLMYHRIADDPCDPWGLAVTPAAFEEHMAFLAERRAAVDLADLARPDAAAYTRDGRHVAVTFDDGYADNLDAALPILERYQIPFTIFVISGTLGRTREFWWDALSRAILFSDVLPPVLELRLGGDAHVFELADTAAAAAAARSWRAEESEPGTPRERLYLQLWELLAGLTLDEQDDAIDHLLAWAGMPAEARADRLPANAERFARLADHPLLTIGSHTRHHRMLTRLSPDAQKIEIATGHREIADLTGRSVDRFSYPYGRFDASSRAIVAGLDLTLACQSGGTVADRRSELLGLPRISVYQCDGAGFKTWLSGDYGLLGERGLSG